MRYGKFIWPAVAVIAIVIAGLNYKTIVNMVRPAKVEPAQDATYQRQSSGIVSMADAYIEDALTKPMDALYSDAIKTDAGSGEAGFRLGLALLAGRKPTAITAPEFQQTPDKAQARYWLDRAKPAAAAMDVKADKAQTLVQASAPAKTPEKASDYTPLTPYVFETGVECIADLKASLKTPTAIAIDQAKDSCWGAPAYERYKAELAKNP